MWFSGFVAGGLSSGSVQGVSVLVSFWWMWRFKNFVDIVVVVFSLRPSFFVYFFLYAFVLLERFIFLDLSCFLLVQLFFVGEFDPGSG